MKLTKPALVTSLILSFCLQGFAQVVFEKETVPELYINESGNIPTLELPELDQTLIHEEDEDPTVFPRPFKFGYLHEVNLSLENAGVWSNLKNGDRVWQLKIYAPDAHTINLNYGKFDIPIGGKLYVYNDPLHDVLGPFTHRNVKANRKFATGFTKGTHCTVEYREPALQKGKGRVEISGIVHGYRSLNNIISENLNHIQSAGLCDYDVGCPLGDGWENQIKSVAMVMAEDNTGGCTGTLINTTANNCEPYFLTADHCFPNDNPGDELNNIFLFNYDSPDPICPGLTQSAGPVNQTVQGCTVVAKSGLDGEGVDFCLLRLSTNPIDFYDVYYSGWDRRNIAVTGAVGIHHTDSNVKKICIDEDPIVSSDDNIYWWVRWDEGTSEGGASGSAVFDMENKRILGQLSGGNATCDGDVSNEGEEDFGKIFYGWDQAGSDPTQQLKPWLDPINSGDLFIDGHACSVPLEADFNPTNESDLIFCEPGILRFKDQSVGVPTAWSWTFSGAGVSPSSSNAQNPEVAVNTDGTLTVTLEINKAEQSPVTISRDYQVAFYDCIEDTYCASPSESIPDLNEEGLSSSITIPSGSDLADLNIEVDISHTYIADIVIKLEHEGTELKLISRPNHPVDDCFGSDLIATFDDEATSEAQTTCDQIGVAIAGPVIPIDALSVFKNTEPGGVWTLKVMDRAPADTGVLNSWCIKTNTIDLPSSIGSDLSLGHNTCTAYPNPVSVGSKINFTTPDKIESIKLYNPVGQSIEINQSRLPNYLPKGVYLLELTLKSGKKEIEKLIVE